MSRTAQAPVSASRAPSESGRGGRYPAPERAIRISAAPAVSTSASSPRPKEAKPVCESPGPNWIPYQGNSMLPGTSNAPIAARRAGGSRERKSSVQRLPPTVARVQVVPPSHLFFAKLPAEVDLLAVADGGEVDQAALDVPDHDAGLLDRQQHATHLEERLPDLSPGFASAVRGRRLGEHRVRVGVGEHVPGLPQLTQQGLQPIEDGVRLLDREVALVDHLATRSGSVICRIRSAV